MTDNEVYESNLQHFKISKRYESKAQCRCPAHNDKQASLTITKGRKCTLFHCHAGCTLEDILSAAGLEKKDTFYDSEPQRSNWRSYVAFGIQVNDRFQQDEADAVLTYLART